MNLQTSFARAQSRNDNSLPADRHEPDLKPALDEMTHSMDTFDNWLSMGVLPTSVAAFLAMSLSRPLPRTDQERDDLVTLRDWVRRDFDDWAQTRTAGGPTSPLDRWCEDLGPY